MFLVFVLEETDLSQAKKVHDDWVSDVFGQDILSESVSTVVWCAPGFGTGFEIALEPPKLQNYRENHGTGHCYYLRQTLVQKLTYNCIVQKVVHPTLPYALRACSGSLSAQELQNITRH